MAISLVGILQYSAFTLMDTSILSVGMMCHFILLHIHLFMSLFVLVSLYVGFAWVVTNIW